MTATGSATSSVAPLTGAPTTGADAGARLRRAAGSAAAIVRRVPSPARVGLLLAVLLAVYGTGYVGYDTGYALFWGRQLGHGHGPDFHVQGSPTSHPLNNLFSALLSIFGPFGSVRAAGALGLLWLALLGVAAYRLGSRLFWPWAGVVFALILLTRARLLAQALNASIEIPWLALVLGAAAIEARAPRRWPPVMALLAVAGLLRPETWLLAGAYAVYLLWGSAGRKRWRIVAAALAGPALWLLTDLVLAGDPFFSLSRTHEVGERDQTTSHSVFAAAGTAVRGVGGILHVAIAVAGVLGIAYVLVVARRRAWMPLTIFATGTLAFFAIAVSNLPTITRFFFLPSAMLALFASAVLTGWRAGSLPRWRGPVLAACAIAAVAALAQFPGDLSKANSSRNYAKRLHRVEGDLHALIVSRAGRATLRRCRTVSVTTFRLRPFFFLWGSPPYPSVEVRPFAGLRSGAIVRPPNNRPRFAVPPGYRQVARTPSLTLYEPLARPAHPCRPTARGAAG